MAEQWKQGDAVWCPTSYGKRGPPVWWPGEVDVLRADYVVVAAGENRWTGPADNLRPRAPTLNDADRPTAESEARR